MLNRSARTQYPPREADARPRRSTPASATQPENVARVALDDVIASLEVIEKNAADTQALLRILNTRLDGQLQTLNVLREIISGLRATSNLPTPAPLSQSDSTQLKFYCLGPFEVYWGEERIPLRQNSKGRTILQYLASADGQPVQRDQLLEVLWPDTEPNTANNRLKVTMHQLRQTFVPTVTVPEFRDFVVFHDGCYLLNPDIHIWTDVAEFERQWRSATKLERQGHTAEAIAYYAQAESLYRGDFLQEDVLEEWTLVRREGLKDTYLTTLDKLSQHWLKTDHTDRAIEGWKKILAKDPWREDSYRNLMHCFAERGQRAVALRWYETCVRALKDQLGIDPEPETVALYQRIRSARP